jgi:hypothetical protein
MIKDYNNPHGKPSKKFNSIEFLLEQVVMGTYEYGEDKILCKTLPKSMIEQAKEMHKEETIKFALFYAYGQDNVSEDLRIKIEKWYDKIFGGFEQ